jgi:superfamily II DNA or RNA helicase
LSIAQINKIKNDLMVNPFVQGSPGGLKKTFPTFRESMTKLYVPQYYGESMFGLPKSIKTSPGESISLNFQGTLRENQNVVVNAYVEYVELNQYGNGLLELPCAYGKTVLALNIISRLQKKTLVIVHKEFLMNQWIERIQQFLPGARIGKIQGKTIDIDDKDIVIGMLQSLSMKEYSSTVFDSIGFTIIDEVHHISSEVFSNALFKIVTKNMLGLSATMTRKDGTTNVFKRFLGEVIFKGKRDEERNVQVRGIHYNSKDDEFNHVVSDHRGNPAYSTMICKLCEYNRRSEFILKVLSDLLEENNEQQIMILAHNKSILKYLFDAIEYRKTASVGYYVGGMKEKALKETEGKSIVIATYAMASEALDIKTLTTLIMATPKTDIEQSVGRILRDRHSKPIVVDIIDHHSIFQNQWKKRKRFYKKENYTIYYTTNASYSTDMDSWKILYTNTKCKKTMKSIDQSNMSSITIDNKVFRDRSETSDSESDEESKKDNIISNCLIKIK